MRMVGRKNGRTNNFSLLKCIYERMEKLGLTEVDQEYMEKLLQNFFTERENHVGKSFLGDLIQGTGGAIKWVFLLKKFLMERVALQGIFI